ncbi:MAG: SRPBCC family protein [Sphingobacteriaceae bacterium]
MKIVRTLLIIIIILFGIFLIGGFFLPKTHKITQSVAIRAADSTVYRYVLDMRNFKQWDPWSKMEPGMQTNIMGTIGQPGYTYAWKGDKVGKGKLELVNTMPNQLIAQELTFYMPEPSVHQSNLYFESNEVNATKVTWTFEGKNNSFFERWLYVLMMNRMIGKDYQDGLKNLKTILEK